MTKDIELKIGDAGEFIVMCASCCGIRNKDKSWLYVADDPDRWDEIANEYGIRSKRKFISHGYCPPCYEKVMREIDNC